MFGIFKRRRMPIQLRVMVIDGLPTIWGWEGGQKAAVIQWFTKMRRNCPDNRHRVKDLHDRIILVNNNLALHSVAVEKLTKDREWLEQALHVCTLNGETS